MRENGSGKRIGVTAATFLETLDLDSSIVKQSSISAMIH